jgi:hypothetical protein
VGSYFNIKILTFSAIGGGGGNILMLKNDPKCKNSCEIFFSAKRGGVHISTLKNDRKDTYNIFSATLLFNVEK